MTRKQTPLQTLRMRAILAVSTALGILLCLACGSGGNSPASQGGQPATSARLTVVPTPTSYTLKGTVTQHECMSLEKLSNATVTVRHESNELIASTVAMPDADTKQVFSEIDQLLAQHFAALQPIGPNDQLSKLDAGKCFLDFSATVPRAKFYQVQVGTYNVPPYSFDELQARNFSVDLTVK